jgi:type IX secretion system PorP/SprF family membrane protein
MNNLTHNPIMKSFSTSLLVLISFCLQAQQDPLYSQYFNNPMLINPAFAGSYERLYAGVAYRTQWTGMDGAPKTFNANGHIALMDNKVGIGAIVLQDQIGDIKNTMYSAVGAYHIKLLNYKFSFGLQMGATRFATDPNAVRVQNPDPLFAQFNETKFNTGAGVLLQNDRYTWSLSVPRILSSNVSQGGQSIQVYGQNFYLYGSYLIYVNDLVQFKPSALVRLARSSTPSVDANFNFIFKRLYTVGIFARNLNSYGLLVQAVMNNYRFGYTFEVPGKSSALNFVTNEVSLSLSLDVLNAHNHSVTGF